MSKAGWGFGFSYGSGGFKPFCGFTRVGLTGFYLEGHRGLGVLLLFGFRILKGLGFVVRVSDGLLLCFRGLWPLVVRVFSGLRMGGF